MSDSTEQMITIPLAQATAWAENCIRINHLQTLLQRELNPMENVRATGLSERARVRAWNMFNEMIAAGAQKPKGYCEPEPE
jgi:hypothetical protein